MSHVVATSTIRAAIESSGLKHVALAPSGTGDVEAIAAPGEGKRIVVVAIHLVASAATVVTLKSGSTALTGAMSLTANQIVDVDGGHACLPCNDNEAFQINQTVDGVDGWATYVVL